MFNAIKKIVKKILKPEIHHHNYSAPFQVDQLLKQIDAIVQTRVEEKLNFYFRWRFPLQLSEHSPLFIHTNDGHRLYVDNKEPFISFHLLEHGEWEAPLRRELRKELTEGKTFIDVGANIGLHTLFATTLVGDKGRVIALEPHPVTREILRKNLEINGLLERVDIVPLAASDQDQQVVSFEYFKEHPAMSGLKVSKEILNKFNGTLEVTDVTTTTVDTLVEQMNLVPDLIKIDVEGFEYVTLQGCIKTIEKFPHTRFLIEYEKTMAESVLREGIGQEIASFFEQYGFKVSRVDQHDLCPLSFSEFLLDKRGDYIFYRS